MDFEKEVVKLIKEYGAPEAISKEIEEFLIGSCNAYSIGEIYIESGLNEED